MKTRTKVGLTLIGLSATSLIISTLNSRDTDEERLKRNVIRVWKNIKDDVCCALNLKQSPKLQFDGEDVQDCVMYVRNTLTITKQSLFNSVITDSETDYIIHVNLKSLARTIRSFKQAIPFSKEVSDMIISHLLYHESRHIWQGEGRFYIGRHHNEMKFSAINEGHGEMPEEKDANEFAINMAKSKREKALAIYLAKTQENAGKIIKESTKVEMKALLSEFNPLLGSMLKYLNYI